MKFGIVFGGQSYEHEVSIISAIAVKNALKGQSLEFIFCDRQRKFYRIEDKNMRAAYFKNGEYAKAKELSIGTGGFFESGMFSKKALDTDVYINLIHGCDGEDGKMAALFEFFGIPYIGPRIEASVLSYNKVLTKDLARAAGVKTLEYEVLKRGQAPRLTLPLIIKPARLGSSIGIGIVKSKAELDYALDRAFELDDTAIAEPYIENIREFNLAGCSLAQELNLNGANSGSNLNVSGKFIYSNIEEPKKSGFLDFDRKYLDFARPQKIEPADIEPELTGKMKDAFTKIYEQGFGGALIRCDFFEKEGEIYLNEINPNPGSLANYLFDDFASVLNALASALPAMQHIPVSYELITKITANK